MTEPLDAPELESFTCSMADLLSMCSIRVHMAVRLTQDVFPTDEFIPGFNEASSLTQNFITERVVSGG